MTLLLDRRSLLLTATLGSAALTLPGVARAWLPRAGFTHSVASGEPSQTSVLLWTRYVPATIDQSLRLRAQISETADFAKIVAEGATVTGEWRDYTAKVTLDGLQPGRRYFYRFLSDAGATSPVGRTRTLPDGDATRFRAAIFSCSNIGFGWFNAYAHAAARDDLDLAIHLGDYIYEYKAGGYPALDAVVADRIPAPENELLALTDYRLRYASYRDDPDLRALHEKLPWIISQDDHESANDSWEGGAENHQPNEGDWSARKAAAMQAWREWMPVSDEPYRAYDIGGLATFFRTDTRVLARSRQPELTPWLARGDAGLTAFRDGPWQDPAATMLGSTQESWLAHELAASVRRGQRWQVAGFGTIMGNTRTPPETASWVSPDASARVKTRVQQGLAASRLGIWSNLDSWGGYPAARARFLKSAQTAAANLIVLSGDSHNAWAYDLGQDGRPAGVEFAGQGVTSPGYESAFKIDPRTVAAGLVAANPELKWCDTSRRGYMALTLTPDRATNDWIFVDTVKTRTPAVSIGHSATVRRDARVMAS